MYPKKDPIPLLPPKKSGTLRTYCAPCHAAPHSARFTHKTMPEAIEFNWSNDPSHSPSIHYLNATITYEVDKVITFPFASSPTDPYIPHTAHLTANELVIIDRDKARAIWQFLEASDEWVLTNRGENWMEIPV